MGLADKLKPEFNPTSVESDEETTLDSEGDSDDEDIAKALEDQESGEPPPPVQGVGTIKDLVAQGISLENIQKDLSATKQIMTREQKQAQRRQKILLQESDRPRYPDPEMRGTLTSEQVGQWLKENAHVNTYVGNGQLGWCFEIPKKQIYRLLRHGHPKGIPALIDVQNRLIIGDWPISK